MRRITIRDCYNKITVDWSNCINGKWKRNARVTNFRFKS